MAYRNNRRRRESFAEKLQATLKICSTIILVMGFIYFGVLFLADRHVAKVNSSLQSQVSSTGNVATSTPAPTDAPTQAPTEAPTATEQPTATVLAATVTPAPTATATQVPTEAPTEQPSEPVLQPQFEQLYAENPDLVGWIKINEDVDLPVLYRDNDFYMDHDFYGAYSNAGSIFLDERNSSDFSDDHMLIYGHNMKNGTMFGELDKYRETEFLQENPFVYLQYAWEEEPRVYVLVSLFDASMNKSDSSYIKITEFDFESDDEKQSFIDSMIRKSMYDIPLEVGPQDQLITLVTCSYSHNNGRFLLMARELREDETEEQILELFQQVD